MRRDLLLVSMTALLLAADFVAPPAQALIPSERPGVYQIRAREPGTRPRRQRAQREQADAADDSNSGAPHVYKVGPGEEYSNPSDVARRVRSGDTVQIARGTYSDCVLWPKRVSGLTIVGDNATINGDSCGGKGLFVIAANNVTIRGITFQGAKVADHNGAGIRAQGKNLTVENSRFIGNENGILGSPIAGSTVIIRNSYFEGNGACISNCAHGIYINKVDRLLVENSEFTDTHHGHHIKSRALKTEIVNNTVHDGPEGNSSYLVDLPNGGDIVITGNKFEKGPNAENKGVAISIGEEVKQKQNPSSQMRIEGNTFSSKLSNQVTFVRNKSNTDVLLKSNKIDGRVEPLSGPGSVN